VAGMLIGRQNRPHLLEAFGQRFDVELENHITLFRYTDVPGMIGRVGACFGKYGSTSSPRQSAVNPKRARRAATASRRWRSPPTPRCRLR
jgi:hypothetical protein